MTENATDKPVPPVPERSTAPTHEKKQDAAAAPVPVYYPYTTTPVPEFIAQPVRGIGVHVERMRNSAIHALPSFVVNNSSNFIGSMQLVAEALYYKSGGYDLIPKEKRGNPISWIVEPPKSIWKGVTTASKSNVKLSDMVKPSFWQGAWKELNDVERATQLDGHFVNGMNTSKLRNKWSARAGMSGIAAMTIATVLPDEKYDPEQDANMRKMASDNTAGYVGLRMYQAVNPLEWMNHKRQFSGLGMMGAGAFSFFSGFRQVNGTFGKEAQAYMRNPWHMAGGLITVMGGLQLMLGVDNQEAWRNFGATQMLRLASLPNSIHHRFKYQEQGGSWYLASTGVFQTKNIFAALVGGAEKTPDGEIIDFKKKREAENQQHPQKTVADEPPSIAAEAPKPATQIAGEKSHARMQQPEMAHAMA